MNMQITLESKSYTLPMLLNTKKNTLRQNSSMKSVQNFV